MSDATPGALRLIDLLWHNVRHHPHQVALRIDGKERTFTELGARVQALAAHWATSIAPGDRIGLWLHNCHAWVECFLALNALGAVAVPINTRLTGMELRTLFELARPHGLVSTGHYRRRHYAQEAREVLDAMHLPLRVWEADNDLPPGEWSVTGRPPERGADGQRTPPGVFCIQYTSGTTSLPKGVMLTDTAYIATAAYVARCQRLTPSSRFISAGPFFHCSGSMHATCWRWTRSVRASSCPPCGSVTIWARRLSYGASTMNWASPASPTCTA